VAYTDFSEGNVRGKENNIIETHNSIRRNNLYDWNDWGGCSSGSQPLKR